MEILILTVGGSHQPLVTSIEQLKPDRVCFLCSDDSDTGKGSYTQVIGKGYVLKSFPGLEKCDLPNIVTIAGLSEDQYCMEKIAGFDDLGQCYVSSSRLICRLREELPEAKIIADYTGGTKSMSAGLAAAALDDERCDIVLVTGARRDLVKVVDRTQIVRPVTVCDIQVERGLAEARKMLLRFDNPGAGELLERLMNRYGGTGNVGRLQRGATLCRAFEAWHRFDHKTALSLLEIYSRDFVRHVRFLKAIINERGHGYEKVEDLVLNAERCACQGRYDDAVARLYRTTEMLAQIRLHKLGINTSNVDLAKVRDESLLLKFEQMKVEKGKVKIGLENAWILLSKMDKEPLAEHYMANKGKLGNSLEIRNNSILAHGTMPVEKGEFGRYRNFIVEFITVGIEKAVKAEGGRHHPAPQLPVDFV